MKELSMKEIYVSRKILYPIFIALFAIIFFSMVFFVSFYQPITVIDPKLAVEGDHFILSMWIRNNSNHAITGADILVDMGGDQQVVKINECGCLAADENIQVAFELPFSNVSSYNVYIRSPLNKSVRLNFPVEESTIRPVKASVRMSTSMKVGQKQDVAVDLCNESESDLHDVTWEMLADEGFFEEELFPQSVSLRVGECKTLYSTLTPIKSGSVSLEMSLSVGKLEQKNRVDITVTN